MSRRFFVAPPALDADRVTLDGPVAHRIANVLRLRRDDDIVLFDGRGDDVRVRLEEVRDRAVTGHVIGRSAGLPEPRVAVHLYQSITKGERFEWLLEKATEIGVASFTPLVTARGVVKTDAGGNRAERWRRIVVEAAEQCGRSMLPPVRDPMRFDDALRDADGVLMLPWEDAGDTAPSIAQALDRSIDEVFATSAVSLLIGPEGGYEADEVRRASGGGATVVTMGRRVLRSETAGLVAAALVLQASGEFG